MSREKTRRQGMCQNQRYVGGMKENRLEEDQSAALTKDEYDKQ